MIIILTYSLDVMLFLRGPPPLQKPSFLKKSRSGDFIIERWPKSPLSEYIWLFKKRTDFHGHIGGNLGLLPCFSFFLKIIFFEHTAYAGKPYSIMTEYKIGNVFLLYSRHLGPDPNRAWFLNFSFVWIKNLDLWY